MNQPTGQRIRRGMNFLSMLGAKLRDLQGTATLAHELIQNAEDAVGKIKEPTGQAAAMVFRLDEKALIVENAGVFSDCGDPHRQPCEWQTPCDFHGFTDVGSGRKRLEEKQKGAFGFGFTAVYQITDHPEVISSKRHWILEDEKPEDQRIFECGGCERCRAPGLPGTKFVLPWAFDRNSPVREALKVAPVPPEGPRKFLQELLADLPHTLLFLDHIKTIQVYWKDQLQLSVSRIVDAARPHAVTIVQNDTTTRWMILSAEFEKQAVRLRATHPPGEKKPISTVKIAIPDQPNSVGLFFAFLPTQQATGFPFHINADFFPTNDRKRLLLESDYQAEWNRAAIQTAAVALKDGLLELRSFLGPKGFWQLLDSVHRLSTGATIEATPQCRGFWAQLVPVLKSAAVVPTANGTWLEASKVYHLSQIPDDETADLYRALGIQTVAAEVNDFRSLLTSESVGVRELDAEALALAIRNVGLTGLKPLSQMPTWFQNLEHWDTLWAAIKLLASPVSSETRSKLLLKFKPNPLAQCALVQCIDGSFRNCCDVFVVDSVTRQLFESLKPSLSFAQDNAAMIEAVQSLCKTFTWDDVIAAAESAELIQLKQKFQPLLKWLSDRSAKIEGNAKLIERIKALPICPTASGLRPFSTVVLPGGFTDPVGVTDLVDEKAIAGIEPLIRILGLKGLTLREYITERLPKAFSSGRVDPKVADRLVELLASHQGEFLDDEEIKTTLSSLPFILCDDGFVRSAADGLYFRTELIQDVLDDSVCYVAATNCTTAIRNFLTWLGVSSEPDIERVTNYLIETASSSDDTNEESIAKVQSLFEHLGNRRDEIVELNTILQNLRSKPWLPSSGREWCPKSNKWIVSKSVQWSTPPQTCLARIHYLVESTAQFISFPTRLQDHHRELLVKLGVVESPRPTDVVRHLAKAAGLGATIDRRLYQFLDRSLDERSLTVQQLSGLKDSACLFDAERAAFFKPSHCFTEKHPFGNYRVILTADTLSSFTNLLKALDVRSEPIWVDAIDVLREIANSETVSSNRAVSDVEKQVVLACWRMIEAALRDEKEDSKKILAHVTSMTELRVVCRPDNLMSEPGKVFFRDREHLADAFSETLGASLIPVPQRAAEILANAGVRKLSEVTTTEILFDELPSQNSIDVTSRLQERASLLIGVMETCKATRSRGIPDFEHQAVSESKTLTVQHSFNGFPRPIPSSPRNVLAIFDECDNHLYYCREDGSIPWDAIACELAHMFLGSGDVPQLSAQLSAVLEPPTLHKARRKLSRLGFPVIELVEEEPIVDSTISSFGQSDTGKDQHDQQVLPAAMISSGPPTPEVRNTPTPSRHGSFVHEADDSSKSHAKEFGTADTNRTPPRIPFGQSDSGEANRQETPNAFPVQSSANQNREAPSQGSAPIEINDDEFSGFDDDMLFIEELANRKSGSDRRHDKVSAESDLADRRRSELVWRQQRVNRISKGDVEYYLRNYYSRDGHLYCQMRHVDESDLHRMPFRKKDGEEWWVRIELLNGKWAQNLAYELPEYKSLFVVLCPNCAALYTEFVRNLDAQQDELFKWFATTNETEFLIKCSLNGRQADRVLHFDPKHLSDIRAVKGIKATSS
jgi:hypothetical protein